MTPSEQLDRRLATVVVAQPGEPPGALPSAHAWLLASVAATVPLHRRASEIWRWWRRHEATLRKRAHN